MNTRHDLLETGALALVAILYFWSGVTEKLVGWSHTVAYIALQDLPFPSVLAGGALIVELALPLMLLAPRTRAAAALLLAIYTLATAALFHTFWHGDDAAHNQFNNFMKNLALTGALLYVCTISLRDAVDRTPRLARSAARSMRIRLG